MAGHRFCRADIQFVCVVTKYIHDGFHFGYIAEGSGSTVGINVIKVSGFHSCVVEGGEHNVFCSQSFWMWCGDVICICSGARSCNFYIDLCTSFHSVFVFLKYQNAGAFTHYKAIAVVVVRTACGLEVIISFAQCFHCIEPADASFADHAFGAAGQYNVCLTKPDEVVSFHYRIR